MIEVDKLNDINPMDSELIRDVIYFKELAQNESDNDNKNRFLRAYLRSFCSLVEYSAEFYKNLFSVLIHGNPLEEKMPIQVLMFLNNLDWKIEDNGELAVVKKGKTNTKLNIKATLRYINAFVPGVKIDLSGPGYNSLTKVFKIRDRITYPRDNISFEILPDEFESIKVCSQWFSETITVINDEIRKTLKENV